MEAVTDPWLFEGALEDEGPDTDSSGEGFRLIAGV
jgi:hypothetical protein